MIIALLISLLVLNCVNLCIILVLLRRLKLHENAITVLAGNQDSLVTAIITIQTCIVQNTEVNGSLIANLNKIVERVNSHQVWNIIKSEN